jgi:SAM-dependent methyltransferase
MNLPVVLHVRTNIDWRTMTEEAFLRQEDVSNSARAMSAEQKERFLAAIRLWNRTFGMSYFAYRQRLKEIAELSWTRIRNLDAIVRVPNLMPALDALERYIVLPVDDDDWFHPDVADVLRQHWRPNVDAFHWPDVLYRPVPFQDRFDQPVHQERLGVRRWDSDFATNGYALTRAGLGKCKAELRRRVLAFHWSAGKTFHSTGFERSFIDRPLSASNKSLASCTNLNCMTDRATLLRNVPHLSKRTTGISPTLEWTADYVARTEDLNAELCGDIGRSGAGQPPSNRLQLLNYLVRTRGYESYLEIGCEGDRTFAAVAALHKIGIDPRDGGTLRMKSDDFFQINRDAFDLVFIDGLHHCEQVLRDVQNSLAALRAGGCIVLHDCLPTRREHQERRPIEREWTGDVWKAVVALRRRSDCDTGVLDADWGLGVVLPRPNSSILSSTPELTWETYVARRDELLRVVDFSRLERFLAGRAEPDAKGAMR